MDKTIIFCTENKCPEPLFSTVIEDLKKKANGCPIVSVSHKPIDLGTNICIGERPRSWACLYNQLLKGCEAANTKYIMIAEHDCFYSEEQIKYIPPTDDRFYYNENIWLVCFDKEKHPDKYGQYSRFWKQRLALSQLVCDRELYIKALQDRLELIGKDRRAPKCFAHFTEPGVTGEIKDLEKLRKRAHGGTSAYLRPLLPDFIELEQYETFDTKIPSLDVRHGGNFTGPRRGRQRTYNVPYWGKFTDMVA